MGCTDYCRKACEKMRLKDIKMGDKILVLVMVGIIGMAANKYEENWAKYKVIGMQSERAAAEIPNTEALWAKYMKEVQNVKNLVAEGKQDEAWKAYKNIEDTTVKDLLKSLQGLR